MSSKNLRARISSGQLGVGSSSQADEQKVFRVGNLAISLVAFMAPTGLVWLTFPIQMNAVDFDGHNISGQTVNGVLCALGLAVLTAACFGSLMRNHPKSSGILDCVFEAFSNCRTGFLRGQAVMMTEFMGYSATLYYYVYPAVTAASIESVIIFFIQREFMLETVNWFIAFGIAILSSCAGALITLFGSKFSAEFNTAMLAIDTVIMVFFCGLFFAYRLTNPEGLDPASWSWTFKSIFVFDGTALIIQTSIAMLILLGFESAVQFGPETHNPPVTVPLAMLLSLTHPAFIYIASYMSTFLAISDRLVVTSDGTSYTGASAVQITDYPIAELSIQVGSAMCSGHGYFLVALMMVAVIISIFGSLVAAMNTAIRTTYFMAMDGSLPVVFAALHPRHGVPHRALAILCVLTGMLACVATVTPIMFNAVSYTSNIGAFLMYSIACYADFVSCLRLKKYSYTRHALMPLLGTALNLMMAGALLAACLTAGGDSMLSAVSAFALCALWAMTYLIIRRRSPAHRMVCKV